MHMTDRDYMERAIALARKGLGRTNPNPLVGAVIVKDGRIIGAVTHVLVNDPTTGYGIFIENMLEAAA